jgi:hypothetical protein
MQERPFDKLRANGVGGISPFKPAKGLSSKTHAKLDRQNGNAPLDAHRYRSGSGESVGFLITRLNASLIGRFRLMPRGGIGDRNHLR